jgi:hypothetical protein
VRDCRRGGWDCGELVGIIVDCYSYYAHVLQSYEEQVGKDS